MASEPAGVPSALFAGERRCTVSQNGDSTTGTVSRPAVGQGFSGPSAEDFERLKLCVARQIWRRRNQPTPSGRMTWGVWFEQKYGQSLANFERSKRGG